MRLAHLPLAAAAVLLAAASTASALGLTDVITAPKTLVDRAIEARSTEDIAKDNAIVVKVNGIMGKHGTIKASTEIYEQRLLITGMFDDKVLYDEFLHDVKGVDGVKKLYWHVKYMSADDQKKAKLLDWSDVLVISNKAQARLVGTAGVADVNYRTTADSFGIVYIIGRARSQEEHDKALVRVRDGDGVKKVIDYVEVRP